MIKNFLIYSKQYIMEHLFIIIIEHKICGILSIILSIIFLYSIHLNAKKLKNNVKNQIQQQKHSYDKKAH